MHELSNRSTLNLLLTIQDHPQLQQCSCTSADDQQNFRNSTMRGAEMKIRAFEMSQRALPPPLHADFRVRGCN